MDAEVYRRRTTRRWHIAVRAFPQTDVLMPNGGEDKHAKLRTAWNRLRRRHPTELEQFGPEPWDEETGKLTPEASAAYRKIAQPAPTPAAAHVTPTVTAPTAMP